MRPRVLGEERGVRCGQELSSELSARGRDQLERRWQRERAQGWERAERGGAELSARGRDQLEREGKW
ncbi:hypothetical protein T484DRAFT_1779192 [Baffinella frigidus]|nr:hypothetical protein T484DRAFT_1779192 [Cryptophyta sp. CCMP2293]